MRLRVALGLVGVLSCATAPSPPQPPGTPPGHALAPGQPPGHAASVDAGVADADAGGARTDVQLSGTVTEIAPDTYLITRPAPPIATLDAAGVRRSVVQGKLDALDVPAHDPPPVPGSFPDLGPALDARLRALFHERLGRELRAAVVRAAPAGFTLLDLRPFRHRCERQGEAPAFLAHEVFRSLECLYHGRVQAQVSSGELVVRDVVSVRAQVVGGERRSLGKHTMATARETREIVLQLAVRWRIDAGLRLSEETVLLPHALRVTPGPDHVEP